jgi:hypothetical protein
MPMNTDPIPGIFNYCDRWCERCPQTAHCRLFAMDQENLREHPELRDPANKAFWEALAKTFAKTAQMIRDEARDRGIDLDADVPEAREFLRREKRRHRRSLRHRLVKSADHYAQGVNQWFDRHEDLFREKKEELIGQVRLGLEGADPEAEAIRLADAVDVIRWYQYQIEVKLVRAVGDVMERDEEEDEDLADSARRDAVGSAKVALLGIERSLAAWSLVRAAMGDGDDAVLDLLVELDRLRRAVDSAFPEAKDFVRPGLDTPVAP